MKLPRGDFSLGRLRQVPARAYQATTPPARAAGSRGAGFMYPGRFGAWRKVIIHGKPMAENGQSYFRGILRCGARVPGDGARIPVGGCGLSVRRGWTS